MRMINERYNTVRERLITLHRCLSHNVYEVWIAPKSMMSIDEVRNREVSVMEDTIPDVDFFNTPQLRQLKATHLLDYLENFTSTNEIGFQNSHRDVIPLYENIQEYISLWCEIILNAPEFGSPPKTELRKLENLAYILFPTYKEVKPYVQNQEHRDRGKLDKELGEQGLLGLGALFSMNAFNTKGNNNISFISHLNDLEATAVSPDTFEQPITINMDSYQSTFVEQPARPVDSISSAPSQSTPLADWIFKEH